MKRLKLDDYHEVIVSDAAYEQIMAIIEQGQVCKWCSKPYAGKNPQVAEHTCLTCFLKREANQHLTFVGLHSETKYTTYYSYRDSKGYIYLSSTAIDRVERSNYDTALHWGFTVPGTFLRNGEDQKLASSYWSIYGDFKKNSVIVIEYWESYGERLRVAFLTNKKDGTLVEINKRKGDIRKLFSQARERVEATRDEHGSYHVGDGEEDWTTYQIADSHLYRVISDIASAAFDKSHKEDQPQAIKQGTLSFADQKEQEHASADSSLPG